MTLAYLAWDGQQRMGDTRAKVTSRVDGESSRAAQAEHLTQSMNTSNVELMISICPGKVKLHWGPGSLTIPVVWNGVLLSLWEYCCPFGKAGTSVLVGQKVSAHLACDEEPRVQWT